ncbi:hypothetical protein HTZ77_24555 [Nonomuraea sp. SMC257]|uniref:Uncharacterized protein n=1 Tax=Nonomuraea montanisoli TaxID=2741721 RepID=A0A7Y6IBC9_9ACTN|nr:hypothetical protein [Nonomuraea montanisoli]NUW34583.1 hypothetical protein [Nonomuraea montanisoli]
MATFDQIGVGTNNPTAKMEVVGDWNGTEGAAKLTGDKPTLKLAGGSAAGNEQWIVHVGGDGPGNLGFYRRGAAPTSWELAMCLSPAGRIGAGTTNPAAKVDIVGDWTGKEGALRIAGDKPTIKFAGGPQTGNAQWIVHVGADGPGNLEFYRQDANVWELVMSLRNDGSLHTSQAVHDNMMVNGDITLAGADFAEEFDVLTPETSDPGTVMVLDETGAVRVSDSAYDHRVAGVVSGAGEYKPAVIADRRDTGSNRLALALMGKAYCKVDAALHAVAVGDLLTTSSTPGHAMKALDRSRAHGAIIGKALGPLPAGQGLVPILVTLQ